MLEKIQTPKNPDIPAVVARQAIAAATTRFYDTPTNEPEVERLRMMADVVDETSLRAISPKEGSVVADFGAGDSPSLGHLLQSHGVRYFPIDQRPDAINRLRSAGFNDAQVASVVESGMRSHSADVVHARFVMGWLNDDARKATIQEMLRVVRPGGRLVLIDYDWGGIEGPAELQKSVSLAQESMTHLGFDPLYGQKLPEDARSIAQGMASSMGGEFACRESHREESFVGTLSESVTILRQTAGSILFGLNQLGMLKEVRELEDALKSLEVAADANPDARVRLADTVVQIIDIVKPINAGDRPMVNAPGELFCKDGEYEMTTRWEEDPPKHIVRAVTPEMIHGLRRLQADAYRKDGLVGRSAVVEGVLSEGIDPIDQVRRSRYFTTVDQNGQMLSCVRYIVASEEGPRSLRAFEAIPSELRADFEEEGRSVIEISAFAKRFGKGSLLDVIGSVIALADDARKEGHDIAIMELQEGRWRLIREVFGADNFTEICSSHTIALDGVNQDKKYRVLQCDVATFLDGVRNHAQEKIREAQKSGSAESRLFRAIDQAIARL